MTSPLVSSLATTIGRAFNSLFMDATFTQVVTIDGPTPWEAGTPGVNTYSCKCIHDTWNANLLAEGLVAADEAKLLILATSLPLKPAAGDAVTIRGETFTIAADGGKMPAVSTDPALAVWVIRAKR
jgi:hypothetical protein